MKLVVRREIFGDQVFMSVAAAVGKRRWDFILTRPWKRGDKNFHKIFGGN